MTVCLFREIGGRGAGGRGSENTAACSRVYRGEIISGVNVLCLCVRRLAKEAIVEWRRVRILLVSRSAVTFFFVPLIWGFTINISALVQTAGIKLVPVVCFFLFVFAGFSIFLGLFMTGIFLVFFVCDDFLLVMRASVRSLTRFHATVRPKRLIGRSPATDRRRDLVC